MSTTEHSAAPIVLVADDDPTTRLLIEATLSGAGFEVVSAADGVEAIGLVERARPDLAFLDVDMPRASGFEVCAHIRSHPDPRLRQVPVVIATGMDDPASVATAYERGATDYVAKPVNLPSLVYRLRYILRAHDATQNLVLAEERNRAMLSALPDAILQLDRNGQITAYRQGQGGMQLTHLGDCVGRSLSDFLPSAVTDLARQPDADATAPLSARVLEFAWEIDGAQRHYEARYVPGASAASHLFLRDITQRKEYEARIRTLAYCDSLTGMPNRQAFIESLEREVARARLSSKALAVLFMDLDGFKRVNDTLGHSVGDHLLQAVASRLKQVLRPRDLIARDLDEGNLARLGGDEFTILLPDIQRPEDAIVVAHRVRDEIRRPFVIDTHEIVVSASIGVSLFPEDGQNAMALVKYADTAMYHAKDTGRDNCQLYSSSLTTRVMLRVSLENRLRKALERGELTLHYQPLIASRDQRVVGMEALVRWNDPDRGLIPPGEFIPVAEESGLILPLGEWVLRTACVQARQWQIDSPYPVRIAVNLSPMQFRDPGLVPTILSILEATGLAHNLLELEVTESALIDDTDAAILRMKQLVATGVRITIDDFGTGYSSLSYLKRFPVRALKIDRGFVNGLPNDADSIAISRAIIAMAHSMKMDVTAEGIETAEQADALRRFGCEKMQGFHFARPMPAENATEWLKACALGSSVSLGAA